MPDENPDVQTDEIEDEMPDSGGAPCGDVFARPDAIHVTDADADITGDRQD
jgi:hypothetical protein